MISSSSSSKVPMEGIDRSNWLARVESSHPETKQLRDRIYPLNRAVAFAEEYLSDQRIDKRAELLRNENIIQLLMQHLEIEGLKESRRELERATKKSYIRQDNTDSRLVTILRIALKDTEKLWDLSANDKFDTDKHNREETNELLLELDLLEREEEIGGDVDIWSESPFNVILDEKDSTLPKAASFNQIIIRMTDEEANPVLKNVVLYTYRTFTTPEKLFQKMVERFQVPEKNPDGSKNDPEWKSIKAKIQVQVINVIKTWIREHFEDFSNSDKMMSALQSFIQFIETDTKAFAQQLVRAISVQEAGGEKTITEDISKKGAPEPKIPWKTIFTSDLTIFHCDEEEIARQLCLMEFEIYSAIKPSEFMNQAWTKPKTRHRAPNILKISERSTHISQWVSSTVLQETTIKKRVKILIRFIKIAEELTKMNNFSTAIAIVVGGLNSASIYRLKHTWNEVPAPIRNTFNELHEKYSDNWQYRQMLNAAHQPCIPYLGVFQTDLVYIDEIPDHVGNLINVQKRRQVYDVIERVMRYQNKGYDFVPIPQIQSLLELRNMHIIPEEERARISERAEPKHSERASIQ